MYYFFRSYCSAYSAGVHINSTMLHIYDKRDKGITLVLLFISVCTYMFFWYYSIVSVKLLILTVFVLCHTSLVSCINILVDLKRFSFVLLLLIANVHGTFWRLCINVWFLFNSLATCWSSNRSIYPSPLTGRKMVFRVPWCPMKPDWEISRMFVVYAWWILHSDRFSYFS